MQISMHVHVCLSLVGSKVLVCMARHIWLLCMYVHRCKCNYLHLYNFTCIQAFYTFCTPIKTWVDLCRLTQSATHTWTLSHNVHVYLIRYDHILKQTITYVVLYPYILYVCLSVLQTVCTAILSWCESFWITGSSVAALIIGIGFGDFVSFLWQGGLKEHSE